MEHIGRIVPNSASSCSLQSNPKSRVDAYNQSSGNLRGYDCKDCKNRGYFAVLDGQYEKLRPCKCLETRKMLRRMEQSGLQDVLCDCTFDKFIAESPWQSQAKQMAQAYAKHPDGRWFFAGGQVGCGKTHLCTAIVGELLRRGIAAKYMLWRDDSVHLKSIVTDHAAYRKEMGALKDAPALYIDDFFKTERGKLPSTAEINLAFELLNYRYNKKALITVISSEHTMDGIIKMDEAVGSRIYERARGCCVIVRPDIQKNYRLKR